MEMEDENHSDDQIAAAAPADDGNGEMGVMNAAQSIPSEIEGCIDDNSDDALPDPNQKSFHDAVNRQVVQQKQNKQQKQEQNMDNDNNDNDVSINLNKGNIAVELNNNKDNDNNVDNNENADKNEDENENGNENEHEEEDENENDNEIDVAVWLSINKLSEIEKDFVSRDVAIEELLDFSNQELKFGVPFNF